MNVSSNCLKTSLLHQKLEIRREELKMNDLLIHCNHTVHYFIQEQPLLEELSTL